MKALQPIAPPDQPDSLLNYTVRLMEQLVVATFVVDADCRVVIWNRACERLTGIPADAVIGTKAQWRAFYTEPRPCLADLIVLGRTEEIIARYEEHDRVGTEAVFADCYRVRSWIEMPGRRARIYLTADAGPIYDDAGKLVAVVETLRDMTAQKEAQENLQRLATRDGLTGVANRRSFDETLEAEWLRGTRDVKPLSLVMIDVDHFKRYNDAFGHQGGDVCLKAVARAMSGCCLRSADTIARYGGEEFAAILPSTTESGALLVAERIRTAILALDLPHPQNDGVGRVSASLGVATLVPDRTLQLKSLIEAADTALYAAKREGRNRAVQARQVEV